MAWGVSQNPMYTMANYSYLPFMTNMSADISMGVGSGYMGSFPNFSNLQGYQGNPWQVGGFTAGASMLYGGLSGLSGMLGASVVPSGLDNAMFAGAMSLFLRPYTEGNNNNFGFGNFDFGNYYTYGSLSTTDSGSDSAENDKNGKTNADNGSSSSSSDKSGKTNADNGSSSPSNDKSGKSSEANKDGGSSDDGVKDNSLGGVSKVEVQKANGDKTQISDADGDLKVYTLAADEVYVVTYSDGTKKVLTNNHDLAHVFWNRNNERSNAVEDGKLQVNGNKSSNQNTLHAFSVTMNKDATMRLEKSDVAGMSEDLMLYDKDKNGSISLEEYLNAADVYAENCKRKAGASDSTERNTGRVSLSDDDKIYLTALFKSMTVDNNELTVDEYKNFLNGLVEKAQNKHLTRTELDDYANEYRANLKKTAPAKQEKAQEEVDLTKINELEQWEKDVTANKEGTAEKFDVFTEEEGKKYADAVKNGQNNTAGGLYNRAFSNLGKQYVAKYDTIKKDGKITLDEFIKAEKDSNPNAEEDIKALFNLINGKSGDDYLTSEEIAAYYIVLDKMDNDKEEQDGFIGKSAIK